MKVAIALGNRMLSEALMMLLRHADRKCGCEILMTDDLTAGIRPDASVIVTNYLTVPKIPPEWFESCKIVVIDSGLERESIVSLFLTEKIAGIISAESDVSMFLKALNVIHKGEIWIDNPTVKSLLTQNLTRRSGKSAKITERESAILRLVREGYRNKEIAHALSISEQTVKSHLNRIFRKMNVSGRTELVAKLAGVVDPQ